MELPPYRLPTLRSIGLQAWQRIRAFVRKAWTVILAMSVLVWALMAVQIDLPNGRIGAAEVEESLFAGLANAAAPLFAPLGFGSWQATGSLLTGIVAKEVVVSSLAQTYGVAAGDDTASGRVRRRHGGPGRDRSGSSLSSRGDATGHSGDIRSGR